MEEEFDFTGKKDEELKDMVVRNVERIQGLKMDGKEYSKSIRESVKDLESRNAAIIEELESRRGQP